MPRGGKRAGAGRPPLPESERRQLVKVWLRRDIVEWLQRQESLRTIEELLEREKAAGGT